MTPTSLYWCIQNRRQNIKSIKFYQTATSSVGEDIRFPPFLTKGRAGFSAFLKGADSASLHGTLETRIFHLREHLWPPQTQGPRSQMQKMPGSLRARRCWQYSEQKAGISSQGRGSLGPCLGVPGQNCPKPEGQLRSWESTVLLMTIHLTNICHWAPAPCRTLGYA